MRKEVKDVKFMLSIMMDYYWEDASKAKHAVGGTRQKQKALIELLLSLTKLFNKHEIAYWLDYGTLLGAVRHNGFIPWDDDLDIGVLNKDRDKIKQIIIENLDSSYKIYDSGEHEKFLKFEKYYGTNRVSIDIFTYSDYNGKLQGTFFPSSIVYNKPFPKEAIFPLSKITFEGIEYSVPKEYHLYLKKNYGEYMSLPKSSHYWPHEKWNSHHDFYPVDQLTK